MNGADLIAAILKKEGVEYIPAFPHSDIIDCGAKLGIVPLIVRQERHALHIADGYARMTGGRKICCTTVQYGPGSENAVGAVAQCYGDNVPVLHMPGGYARADQGIAPNYNAARNMQLINKWCEMVYQADRIPQMMQNAFAMLKNGRPGPVTLEVPIDIFTEEVDPALLDSYKPQRRSAPCADLADIAEIADILLAAKAPVIIAGQGILYAEAWDELIELAELTDTPVISTLNGKSCFPENHPLYVGCAGGARPDGLNRTLERADVYIGLGTSFTTSDYITPFPRAGRTFVQLTNWEGDISKDYPVDLGVIGDAKPSMRALISAIKDKTAGKGVDRPAVIKTIAAEKQAFLDKLMPMLTSDEIPISPYRVVWDLMHTVDRTKTVLTHDAGSPRDQITPYYEAIVPHGYMGWGKTTQLGMGLGLMQGAKLANPGWTCVNIMGDAAIGMVGMDFETAVRLKLGTLTIVLKNSIMGGYTKHHPNAAQRYQIEELGGDYAAMARAFGGFGEEVSDPAQIVPAIKRALEQNAKGIPALLQIITKEELNMAKALPEGVGPHVQV
ncbi:thiamine pyrophosphate-requiring protein [Mesorhizobium sp. WSM4303]|uniref:thiamine pyrophosphate-requiring protein n=1 Tax=unclassified Mesorhizobium TaxID=325217 RepID=UPI00115C9753|nr:MULTISPECIES: thiamine pyrophosphate-requiring protein [unclassified Mesorhizobium]TRC98421.1 thiamine pyrophosphate-requiring protein [Mesorhizobium sp. WSM4306]TRC99051.1 thiamine pyrophosphate-requiring protein [Mesorhizobium sp. WSM4303]